MRTTLKGLSGAVAAMVAIVGSAAGAGAGPLLDEAGTALRRDPVYVHPDAEPRVRDAVSAEAQRLRDAVRAGDTPLFIAVLPAEAVREVGTEREAVNRVPGALRQATGLAGTYAVVAGTEFRAASDVVPGVGAMATSAFQQRRQEGVAAVLADFVGRVQRAAATTGAGGREPAAADRSSEREPARSSGAGSGWLVVILFFAGALGLVFWMSRRSAGRPREPATASGDGRGYPHASDSGYGDGPEYGDGYRRGPFGTTRFDPDKARLDLRADLQMLGDDVLALEPDVALSPEARTEYDAGVARYRWAEAAIAAMDSPDDVPRIRRALAEGNYAMARARAIARGDPPPSPPAELTRSGPNDEPAVEIDDDGRPAYAGYRNQGGGWFGGGFFGGNDLFTGLLLGQMLGGMFGGWGGGGGFERGYNEGHDRGQAESERSLGSDAGWGGGDFGGGDFGGGGFGGGDVGGGDF